MADSKSTLFQIENLVGLIQLRQTGASFRVGGLADFDKYSDVDMAKMLCSLAVTHLDSVSSAATVAR